MPTVFRTTSNPLTRKESNMPRLPRVPTRANRLANAVSAFEKAQRELSEISLIGVKDKKFVADVKAAFLGASISRSASTISFSAPYVRPPVR